ncbi:MAG: tRNA 2-thiocytidine biosynthesis TtcA family protein [Erysipelotrichaceae bacterium]|nr:tRNA 2-thiocytidine biosynthesis TtcA family protein [Erysipelotrichaceae bacterium]
MLLKKILGSIRNVDEAYHLINNHDKIAVGISGGKDSVLLLYCLDLYRRFSKKEFSLLGVSIDVGFDNDMSPVLNYFRQREIEIIIEPTKIKTILEQHLHHHSIDCSLCSKLKKGALVKIAKENGCSKLALAHSADDAIETLFLNEIYGGKIATFQPSQYLSREGLTVIRPLIYTYEDDIRKCCQQLALPIVKSNCPRDGQTKRQEMKELLSQIYLEYPAARRNFLLMLHNEKQFAVWHPNTKQD